jgi:hypothetical protein
LVPLKERKKMSNAGLLALPLYHGTTFGNGSERFEVHCSKGRFDSKKVGVIVFDRWSHDKLDGFKTPELAALAWELKISTLRRLFTNYDLTISFPGCGCKSTNADLVEALLDEKYTDMVIEKTLDALRNADFVEFKKVSNSSKILLTQLFSGRQKS